jgi:CHAD domain-containing protein
LRIEGKRLRYVAEFLGELYPGKARDRYLKRMRRLQSSLGRWHDAVVAVDMHSGIGAEVQREKLHAFFQGWYADESRAARRQIKKAWKKLRKARPFWG